VVVGVVVVVVVCLLVGCGSVTSVAEYSRRAVRYRQ
jgi:uncharacterized protein YceK